MLCWTFGRLAARLQVVSGCPVPFPSPPINQRLRHCSKAESYYGFERDKKKKNNNQQQLISRILLLSLPFVLFWRRGRWGMVGKELKGIEGKGRAGRAERERELSGHANPISRIFCTRSDSKAITKQNDMVCLITIEYYSSHLLPLFAIHIPHPLSRTLTFPSMPLVIFSPSNSPRTIP